MCTENSIFEKFQYLNTWDQDPRIRIYSKYPGIRTDIEMMLTQGPLQVLARRREEFSDRHERQRVVTASGPRGRELPRPPYHGVTGAKLSSATRALQVPHNAA